MIIGGMPPLDDAGLGIIEGSLSPVEIGSGLGRTGMSVVKVVWAFETVVCEDDSGASPVFPSPATALDIAPTGLLTGTSVVKVVCESATVTGTDMIGATPLEIPASAVEIAPAGLLIGTLAVIVVSDWGITTGIDTIAEWDALGV